jgi:hypothetical protein
MDNPFINLLCTLGFFILLICLLAIWVFTFRTTFRKMREPGTTALQQLIYLSGCLAAPLVVLFDSFISLASVLLKLFGAFVGVVLFALALLISPLLLLIYLAVLSLKKASVLGERFLQRTIDFPDRIEKRITQILIRLGLVQKPPNSSNSG